MSNEVVAEITLSQDARFRPAPASSWGFVVTFESASFSAAIPDDVSRALEVGQPVVVHLRFLVEGALETATDGSTFTFFDAGRRGHGRVLRQPTA